MRGPSNDEIADALERLADLLEAQEANPFRVRAYRRAAGTVRARPERLAERVARGGRASLEGLPGIGKTLASLIEELVHTGRLAFLERLEGQVSPEDLFTTLSGIGEELAARIHRELGVETLEELELAAHDGRLAALPGFGGRRVRAVRDALATVLGRSTRRRARERRLRETRASSATTGPPAASERPAVATILAVDEEYKTRDWVVIYYERDGDEDQCTVVTERSGALRGRRVVRGREDECARLAARKGS